MNPVVTAIGELRFEGNLIPHAWYGTPLLKHDNGKPNLVAIILLSDILYWYRPTIVRDEETGRIIEMRQKFRAHRLHKDYETWGEHFGFTRRQVQDAVAFLFQRGLIVREVSMQAGFNNRVFVEPVVDVIRAISLPLSDNDEIALRYNGTRPTPERKTPDVSADSVSRQNGTRPTSKGRQDTENTGENTQRTQQQSVAPQAKPKPEAESVVALASALTQDLIAQGVTAKVAQSLVEAYPHAAIRQQLAWLPQRKYADAAATLVESIKEGYDAPAAARKAVPRPRTRAVLRDTAERSPVLTEEQQAASREAMRAALGRLRGRTETTGAASMGETL